MKKILVTGVSVIDFIFQIDEIPKHFEKYRAKDASISGGGVAANAAVAISRLGGSSTLISRLGNDDIGKIIKSGLSDEGVNIKYIKCFNDHKSSFSSVFINNDGERQVMNYRDTTLPKDAIWINDIEIHDAYLADTRWNEGALETLKIAKKFNCPGVLDAEETVSLDMIKIASHVAFSLRGLKTFTKKNRVIDALKEVKKITSSWICVTDGENGVFFLDNYKLVNIPVQKVDVKDTLGAGDVWHGAFALGLAEGKNEIEAVKLANSAATLKCKNFGGRTGFPRRNEVDKFLKEK